MKSLEIVNDKIAELKDTYQHYTAVEKDKAKSSFAKFDIEQFQQIKQDLEVLEIIRKKRVDILALECRINTFKDDNERILHSYNAMFYNKKIYKLTMEELLKLKQWLEVNEND